MCSPVDTSQLVINEAQTLEWDLRSEFNQANRKYFGGELPVPKLRYSGKMKNQLGKVVAWIKTEGKRVTEARIKELAITSFYTLDYDTFMSTLLHEMIHLQMVTNPSDYAWFGGYHGTEFLQLAQKIGSKAGVKIQPKYTLPKTMKRTTGSGKVIVAQHPKNKTAAFFISPTTWGNSKYSVDLATLDFDYGVRFLMVPDDLFYQYPTVRALKNVRKISFYKMDKDQMKVIEKGKRVHMGTQLSTKF